MDLPEILLQVNPLLPPGGIDKKGWIVIELISAIKN
jgi:hypothetical protein